MVCTVWGLWGVGMVAQGATLPVGRVVGPATAATLKGLQQWGTERPAAVPLAAAAGCSLYFDATGQAGFNPPAAGTVLTPSLGPATLTSGGVTSFAHGVQALTATAGGGSLQANASTLAPTSVLASVSLTAVQGIAFFATATNCTQSSFSTVLQSAPAGTTGAGGTVLAQLGSGQTLTATYTPSYTNEGTYYCSTGGGYFLCNVWAVNVAFAFLTNSFAGNGAGTYTLTINQVTLNSP